MRIAARRGLYLVLAIACIADAANAGWPFQRARRQALHAGRRGTDPGDDRGFPHTGPETGSSRICAGADRDLGSPQVGRRLLEQFRNFYGDEA